MYPASGRTVQKSSGRVGGFSILELLVVISVISVLVSLSLPAFRRGRLVAKRTTCMANLRSIGQAMEAYLLVSGEHYPTAAGYPIKPEDREAYCSDQEPEDPPEDETEDRDEGCDLPPIYEVIGTEIGHQTMVFHCPADRLQAPLADRPSRGSYFASLGTSYEWDVWYNGRRVGQTLYTGRLGGFQHAGLGLKRDEAPMIYDYEPFHGGPEERESHVILYADMHVSADKWTEPVTED